jgi:L-fuconolactonase
LVLQGASATRWLNARRRLDIESNRLTWAMLASEGIPLVVRTVELLHDVDELAAAWPELNIVVDHCGAESRPSSLAFAQLDAVLHLAKRPNVFVKVSTLPIHSKMPSPYADMDWVVKRVVGEFGSARCMFGTDMARFLGSASLADLVDQFRVGCDFLSADDRRSLLGGTAENIHRLNWRQSSKGRSRADTSD